MFLYGRLAFFFGLSLSVLPLFASPNAQAQTLEMDQLLGTEPVHEQSEKANWGGIAPDFASPNNAPILYDKNPFKSADRKAFTPETDDFMWTLPVESKTDLVANNVSSGQIGCLPFASSSAPNQAVMVSTISNFGLISGDCLPHKAEITTLFKSVTGLMKIADLQAKIVCFLQDPKASCDSAKVTALKFGESSEPVPEPTVSVAAWLGIAALGALSSSRFKPKKP